MSKTITALFETRAESENALCALEHAGFTKDQVTMLVSEETRARHFGIEKSTRLENGAVMGVSFGGLVSALYLSLASADTMPIPALTLVGLGVPDYEAKLYQEKIRKGYILVMVIVTDNIRAECAEFILEAADAQNMMAIAA